MNKELITYRCKCCLEMIPMSEEEINVYHATGIVADFCEDCYLKQSDSTLGDYTDYTDSEY